MFIGTVTALIFFYEHGGVIEIFGIGMSAFNFIAIYFVSVRLIFRYDRRMRIEAAEGKKAAGRGRLRAVLLKTAA